MKFVLFCHSLASCWNHGNAHFLRGIVTELLARGYGVEVYEPFDGWSLQHLKAEHGKAPIKDFFKAYPRLQSTLYAANALDLDYALEGTDVAIGAQNAHFEKAGAFTGEVSTGMLGGLVTYVIVGHSERRELFGESDEMVARKTARAVEAGLLPVVCVGETKEERDAGGMWDKCSGQVRQVMEALDDDVDGESIVFAYEPIWAIGTGDTATPEDCQDAIGDIRNLLREIKDEDFADAIRILYGGSVKPENAAEIMAQEDVDGALVGGASLEVESFMELVEAAHETVPSER
jgi:triosephosphate isomerase (TIM)